MVQCNRRNGGTPNAHIYSVFQMYRVPTVDMHVRVYIGYVGCFESGVLRTTYHYYCITYCIVQTAATGLLAPRNAMGVCPCRQWTSVIELAERGLP